MSVTGEVGGVGLAYVAREIKGKIPYETTKYDKTSGENVKKEGFIKEPVIVFFSNGTSQVMSREKAEGQGFLQQPEVMGLANVQEGKTPAARYKNAIREADRLNAWRELEQAVINRCVSRSGHPLPLDCTYSDNSIYMDAREQETV